MSDEQCQWCGTGVIHDGMCPRVSAIQYHPDGSVSGIAFHDAAGDDNGMIRDFLDAVSPDILNDRACELIGEAGDTMGECALAALREMVTD